jgi:hypothetical protein
MRRSTGLGLSGYPVVTLLPSGSGASEATALTSYGKYPQVIVRKTNGQLLKFQFTSDNVGTAIPLATDISLKTPSVTVDKVAVTKPSSYSSCNAGSYQVCVSLEGQLDDLSDTSVTFKIYADSNATLLETSAVSQFQYGDVYIGTVNGMSDHWVTLTVTGPYGTTTTSPMYIARQYSATTSTSSGSYLTTVRGIQTRKWVNRFSRYSLKSIVRVTSTGKQSWSVGRGCSIRGGYLYTTRAKSCSIKLKVAATKRYRGTTDWYTVYLR